MHASASFAALVTLMVAVGTTAAPIKVNNPISRVGGHQFGRSVLPVSGSELPNQTYPDTCKVQCAPGFTEDIKHAAARIDDKAEDVDQTVHDEAHVPEAHAHVEIDAKKGGDKTTEPESQPQPERQPQPEPQPQQQPQQQPHEPEGHTEDCLGPSKLQDKVCVTTNLKDGNESLDTVLHDAQMTGNEVETMAGAAPDRVHSVKDKSTIHVHVHVADKGAHILPRDNASACPDAPKPAGVPCELITAAKAKAEGVDPIKA